MLKKNEDDFIQIDAWYFLQMPSICCEALPSLNPTSKLSDKSGNESFSRRWFGEDSMLASTLEMGWKKAPPSYIPRFLLIMLFWDHELVFIPTHPLWRMEQQKSHEHHPTREKHVDFCSVAGLFSLRSLLRKTMHWCIPPNKSGKLLTGHSTESKHVSPTSQMLETDGFQFELLNLITYVSYTFEAINFRYLDSTAVSGPEDTLFRALPITRYILDLPPT